MICLTATHNANYDLSSKVKRGSILQYPIIVDSERVILDESADRVGDIGGVILH